MDRSGFEDLESGTGKGKDDFIMKEIRITTSVRQSDEESLVGEGEEGGEGGFVKVKGGHERFGSGVGFGDRRGVAV